MTATKLSIAALDERGEGLILEFQKLADRYAHSIVLRNSDFELSRLQSVEGTDTESWPPSPPCQQLSIEQQDAGDVALLVGMAGKSHWSMSVQARIDEEMGPLLEFDIACRLGNGVDSIDWLGSTYQVEGKEPLCWQKRNTLRDHVELTHSEGILKFVAQPQNDKPKTVRWGFLLHANDNAGR